MNPATPPSLPPAMDPEQQRIAIAEQLGWKKEFSSFWGQQVWYDKNRFYTLTPNGLPDYLNSLDACHEMEKVLTIIETGVYDTLLKHAVEDRSYDCNADVFEWHATAAQKAEAFLKAKNLWTPTK